MGVFSAIYGEANVSVEKCVEIKRDYVEKQQSCFISVTLESWSGRKLLDPTTYCDKWVPVTTAWRVLRLRMEARSPVWRGAANILNKQSRTADNGSSSSLGVGRSADNY